MCERSGVDVENERVERREMSQRSGVDVENERVERREMSQQSGVDVGNEEDLRLQLFSLKCMCCVGDNVET